MSKYRAGYDDGSGPDHVIEIGGSAVAVTNWGCDCCKAPTDEDEVAMAVRIAACLSACDGLHPGAIPALVEAVATYIDADPQVRGEAYRDLVAALAAVKGTQQ